MRTGGNDTPEGTDIVIMIRNVKNPVLVDGTGLVGVELATAAGALIDEDLLVPGAVIEPGNLTSAGVTLSDSRALRLAEHTVCTPSHLAHCVGFSQNWLHSADSW